MGVQEEGKTTYWGMSQEPRVLFWGLPRTQCETNMRLTWPCMTILLGCFALLVTDCVKRLLKPKMWTSWVVSCISGVIERTLWQEAYSCIFRRWIGCQQAGSRAWACASGPFLAPHPPAWTGCSTMQAWP